MPMSWERIGLCSRSAAKPDVAQQSQKGERRFWRCCTFAAQRNDTPPAGASGVSRPSPPEVAEVVPTFPSLLTSARRESLDGSGSMVHRATTGKFGAGSWPQEPAATDVQSPRAARSRLSSAFTLGARSHSSEALHAAPWTPPQRRMSRTWSWGSCRSTVLLPRAAQSSVAGSRSPASRSPARGRSPERGAHRESLRSSVSGGSQPSTALLYWSWSSRAAGDEAVSAEAQGKTFFRRLRHWGRDDNSDVGAAVSTASESCVRSGSIVEGKAGDAPDSPIVLSLFSTAFASDAPLPMASTTESHLRSRSSVSAREAFAASPEQVTFMKTQVWRLTTSRSGWYRHDRRALQLLNGTMQIFQKGSDTVIKHEVKLACDVEHASLSGDCVLMLTLRSSSTAGRPSILTGRPSILTRTPWKFFSRSVPKPKVYFFEFPSASEARTCHDEIARLLA